jgi:hypothetical protein
MRARRATLTAVSLMLGGVLIAGCSDESHKMAAQAADRAEQSATRAEAAARRAEAAATRVETAARRAEAAAEQASQEGSGQMRRRTTTKKTETE